MYINPAFISPCGLYCGVCAIYIAHRDNNLKLKEKLLNLYKGKVPDKGKLPNAERLSVDDIKCSGCLSNDQFMHCQQCEIRKCTIGKGIIGCHQCDCFPCKYIENFPMVVGKKVILRTIPYWRVVGTEKWIEDEEARYICSNCGNKLFRGAMRCNKCNIKVDLD